MKKKVLVTREVFDETLEYLGQHFEVASNQANVPYSPQQMTARLQGMDAAVVTTSDRVDEDFLARGPSLKAVCSVSVGFNHIDLEACTRRGVMATNTPGVLTDSVADMAVCLTLATVRRLSEGERLVRARAWEGTHLKQLLGHDLHHATVGICGLGRIGQTIARRLRGFDTKLVYTDLVRADPQVEAALGATHVSKDELLRTADIVILILPYAPQTHYYIGQGELDKMKRSAVLINIARGSIVDDSALARALKERRIWAAGLDVYENEPKINPALFELDNVVLSPHIASATEPTRQAMAMLAARNCVVALAGGDPPNLLNPEVRSKAQAGGRA
ncbi:MAG TPA: D-glycerate dehydrogenase [Burkholderiales bacterium]|jgi:lactate dehydrogenase-like 2-hydroxyacid dehydrogenase